MLKRSERCKEVREERCRWRAESPGQNKCGGRRNRTKARAARAGSEGSGVR